MKFLFGTLLFNLLAAALVQAASAGDIQVAEGHVRALPPTVRNTAAYLRLQNRADEPLVLIGARSDAAASVSLHESYQQDGQMSMRRVRAAEVPAGGELRLEAGGRHLMLMGLDEPLARGDTVQLTLLFRGGLEKTVSLPVRSVLDQ